MSKDPFAGITLGPIRIYDGVQRDAPPDADPIAALPSATWASIDLGDGVMLSTHMRPDESNDAVAQRMIERALALCEKVKR